MRWERVSDLGEILRHAKDRNIISDANYLDFLDKYPSCPTEQTIEDFYVFEDDTAILTTEAKEIDCSTHDSDGSVVTPMSDTIAGEYWIYR